MVKIDSPAMRRMRSLTAGRPVCGECKSKEGEPMGMYDVILAPCPRCGTKNEFQSKGGDCKLATYELHEAPSDVLSDANRHPMWCDNCGTGYKIKVYVSASVEED